MKIVNLKLSQIRPDPNQPRKYFNPDKITELAQTIAEVGVINPIEVDSHYVIITGENRYRAAKQAGLSVIPAKILKLPAQDRFLRQVVENIQYANLTPMEVAHSIQKLQALFAGEIAHRDKYHQNSHFSKGWSVIAKKLGKSPHFVREHLELLDAPVDFQQAINNGLPMTHVRTLKHLPKVQRQRLEKKILSGELKNRDHVRHVVDALTRAPDQTEKILNTDYRKLNSTHDLVLALAQLAPRLSDQITKTFDPAIELNAINRQVQSWCEKYRLIDIGSIHVPQVLLTLEVIENHLKHWRQAQKAIKSHETI